MSTHTKLIRLADDSLVEVEASIDEPEQISGGSNAERVPSTFDRIAPILRKICTPIASTWKELNQDMFVEQAEVEVGLSFEGEGNLYITRAKTTSNLTIRLTMKPKNENNES